MKVIRKNHSMDLLFSNLYLFIFCLQIPEGNPVLLIIDEDVREYDSAVQKCQNSSSGSLWNPKTFRLYENILRDKIHVNVWIGIQQFRSKFVSDEGCLSKQSFTESLPLPHMSSFASIGYCSTFCKGKNSSYFHYRVSNSCICLTPKSTTIGSRCSFRCSSDACKVVQTKIEDVNRRIHTYFTINADYTESDIDFCMVVNCSNGRINYKPKACSNKAGGACDNNIYIDEQKRHRSMKRECNRKNLPLSSIHDKLCAVGDFKDRIYWINSERHVYEAPNDHTGGDTIHCRGMFLNFKNASELQVARSCVDKFAHVCVVDDGIQNITLTIQGHSEQVSPTMFVSELDFINVTDTESADVAYIWGSLLGTIAALTGCIVGVVVYYRTWRKACKNDGTGIKEKTSDEGPNRNYFVLEAKAAHRESTVKNNSKYDSAYQHCELASSSAKVSENEESVYAENSDDVYDELNKRRRVNKIENNQNKKIYGNMVNTVAENGVYNTLDSTIQKVDIHVSFTIEDSEGYGHLKIDGQKRSTDSNYDHC